MRLLRTCAATTVMMLAGVVLSGCPSPVLEVSPGAISFTPDQNVRTLAVRNAGSGTLTWEIQEDLPWLSAAVIAKQTGATNAGSTSSVDLTIDRNLLPLGVTNGSLSVVSNAGTAVVPLSVTKNGPALLEVTTTTLDFGVSATSQTFTIRNNGLDPLTWNLSKSAGANWLTVSPLQGTLSTQGASQVITASINRDALPIGAASAAINITSNGGNASVNVAALVVPIQPSPPGIAFGVIRETKSANLALINGGASLENLTVATTTADGGNWLSANLGALAVPGNGQASLTVTANPADLAGGDYNGSIILTSVGGGYAVNVGVSMTVATLTVDPTNIDFGEITTPTTRTFEVTNIGAESETYSVSVSANDQAWLSVTPAPASLAGNTSFTHTLTANPAAVQPGNYQAAVTVTSPNGTETITIAMTQPRPARLVVVSQQVNFGATGTSADIDIWNDGPGVMDWSIDTSAFPAWLILEGASTGSVIGPDETDSVTLRVNRVLAPVDVFDFTQTFTVTSSGAANDTATVTVTMQVPRIPRIEIEADGVDNNGVPFVNVDVESSSATFVIRNVGNGVLNWNFRPTELPSWISSLTPLQAGLDPNTEQLVTVAVDRTGLSYLGAQVNLNLEVNDPTVTGGVLNFIVEVQVPKRVAITARPANMAFGPDESVGFLEVANNGDPATQLLYRIRSTKESWLKVFPATGSSIGTAGGDKDFQGHSVAIVRSELEGSGTSGKLIIEAIRVDEQGQTVAIPDVLPLEVNVSVEAAELTFQNALPRLRVPSLVRFVLLMRNLQFSPIKLAETRLDILAQQIKIFENSIELEESESQKLAKGPQFIRGNLLVLLDYSNSMQEAARTVEDPDIANAPDPIQALYERCISQLLVELPSTYKVGIAVFSERSGTGGAGVPRSALRPIYGAAGENADTEDELFLNDRALLINRLNNIFVETNGATELYPALSEASDLIVEEDNIAGIFPFDDADDRIVLAFTDGRATTPPGQVTDIADKLALLDRTRAFVVGWGQNVSTGPLVLLSTVTGGHVYATQNELVQSAGSITEIPSVLEMENYCVTDLADECDTSVTRDLEAQYIFNYVSLNEEANVEIEGRLTFDDPTDQASACLPEQGEISGAFLGDQTVLALVDGDPRLGQIKLDYSGVQADGTGQVTIYLDAAPRDITEFSFQLNTVNADPLVRSDLAVTPRIAGGLVSTWTVGGAGLTYTFTSPDGTPLRFGDFGPIATVNLSGIQFEGLLQFTFLSPIFSAGNPNGKYFTAPDALRLDSSRFIATSFPRPSIQLATVNGLPANPLVHRFERLATDELVFDLGEDVNSFELDFYNLGGSHLPTEVGLEFLTLINAQGAVRAPDPIPDDWAEPLVYQNQAPVRRLFFVDRSIPFNADGVTDDEEFQIEFDYFLRGIGYEGDIEPLYLRISVPAPLVAVAPEVVNFPVGVNTQTVTVSNEGQGELTWSLAENTVFPDWLQISQLGGTLPFGQTDTFELNVSRAGQPSGVQTFDFVIVSADEANPSSKVITVNLTVP